MKLHVSVLSLRELPKFSLRSKCATLVLHTNDFIWPYMIMSARFLWVEYVSMDTSRTERFLGQRNRWCDHKVKCYTIISKLHLKFSHHNSLLRIMSLNVHTTIYTFWPVHHNIACFQSQVPLAERKPAWMWLLGGILCKIYRSQSERVSFCWHANKTALGSKQLLSIVSIDMYSMDKW